MTKAKFIVFEGNEGTGKSTHIDFASDHLKKNNIKPNRYGLEKTLQTQKRTPRIGS